MLPTDISASVKSALIRKLTLRISLRLLGDMILLNIFRFLRGKRTTQSFQPSREEEIFRAIIPTNIEKL